MNNKIIDLKFRCSQCGDHICKTEIKVYTREGMPIFIPRRMCLIRSTLDNKVVWKPTII